MRLTRLEKRYEQLERIRQMKRQQDIDGFMIGLGIIAGTLLGCMVLALLMGGYL
jgi:F0F1-type ATP synthase assembly protein I